MKRIAVYLSDGEYEEIKRIAGLVPLSRFLKNLALDHFKMVRHWMPPVPPPKERKPRTYEKDGDGNGEGMPF